MGNPGPGGRLRQLTAGFNSRGLSFGYQRDVFDAGLRAHTYRVGFGAGHGGLAAGLAAAIYRGATKGTGLDFGIVQAPNERIALGVVAANLRQPVVRGLRQPATFVPSITVRPIGAFLSFSATGRLTTDSVIGYAVGVRFQGGTPVPLGALLRLDTDGSFHRTALVIGASYGGRDLIGVIASMLGHSGRIDPGELYAVTSRAAEQR